MPLVGAGLSPSVRLSFMATLVMILLARIVALSSREDEGSLKGFMKVEHISKW